MKLHLKHSLLGGSPGHYTDFFQYIGGQLKIQIIRRRTLRSIGLYDQPVRVFCGEIENISLDDLDIEVRFVWAAQTSRGYYTFVPSFDPIV